MTLALQNHVKNLKVKLKVWGNSIAVWMLIVSCVTPVLTLAVRDVLISFVVGALKLKFQDDKELHTHSRSWIMLISEQYALDSALKLSQEYNMLQEVACFGSCFEQMSETLLLIGIR